MRFHTLYKHLTCAILLGTALTFPLSAAPNNLRYPHNLAWRLITEREIKQITNCPEMPGYEKQHALPLFSQPLPPLSQVQVTPNGQLPLEAAPKTWEIAPFPFIAPPSADSGWQEAVAGKVIEGQAPAAPKPSLPQKTSLAPDVFGEVLAQESPAAALRPRARTAGEQLLVPADRLPEPFSLRRYSTDEHGFFQIALYSGYSSINAEIAFKTLRTAAPNRQAISGLGTEAFLSLVTLPADPDDKSERSRANTLTPDSFEQTDQDMGFADIAPAGSQRFDLTDTAFIKAQQAPFFIDIPIDAENLTSVLPDRLPEALRQTGAADGAASAIRDTSTQDFPQARTGTVPDIAIGTDLPKPASAPVPISFDDDSAAQTAGGDDTSLDFASSPSGFGSSSTTDDASVADPFATKPDIVQTSSTKGEHILVLIMHYPEKDTVVEVAMDTRMGNLQNLIAMAYLIQGRLLQRW